MVRWRHLFTERADRVDTFLLKEYDATREKGPGLQLLRVPHAA